MSHETETPSPLLAPARRFLAALLQMSGDLVQDLERCEVVRGWLQNPGGAEKLEEVDPPTRCSPLVPSSHYHVGDYLTQRPGTEDDPLGYHYPLPGQPCRVVGSPHGYHTPEGSLWDADGKRWSGEDTLVTVNTPDGVSLLAIDPARFVIWTEFSVVDPILAAALQELDQVVERIHAALEPTKEVPPNCAEDVAAHG